VTLTLADMTFGALHAALTAEFGNQSGLLAEIKSKLNEALKLIWMEQKCWRWSLKPTVLTSLGSATRTTTTAITVSPPTTTVTLTPADTASVLLRYELTLPGDPNAYTVTGNAVGVTQIQGIGFLVAQSIGVTATLKQAWLELPDDFAFMHSVRTEGSGLWKEAQPTEPWTLEKVRKYSPRLTTTKTLYTISQDPLPYGTTGWQPNRQFISFWPYPANLTRWECWYYAVPKDMVADGDICELPRGFRTRLIYKAAELLAIKLRDWEAQERYSALAGIGSVHMADSNSFADDSSDPIRATPLTWSQLITGTPVTPV